MAHYPISESPVVDLIFQIILLRMLRGVGVANYINVAYYARDRTETRITKNSMNHTKASGE
jgi:hypothetical protein